MDDLRALIERIAAALGPDATPEAVERVARAVLAGQNTSGGANGSARGNGSTGQARTASTAAAAFTPRAGDEKTRFLVTAYGCDAPGILATITAELSALGANVLDVSQKVLQDYFTVILIADLPGAAPDLGPVRDRLAARAEALGVRVLVQHEGLFQAMHRP